MAELDGPIDGDLPQHVFRWIEAAQRRIATELDSVLDAEAKGVGLRRLRILQLVPPEGARQKELAERALVTKQAMAENVDALEAAGLVERTSDPHDGRAWLVMRSAHGALVCKAMDDAMFQVEQELARSVGSDRYALFKDVLRDLGAEQI